MVYKLGVSKICIRCTTQLLLFHISGVIKLNYISEYQLWLPGCNQIYWKYNYVNIGISLLIILSYVAD